MAPRNTLTTRNQKELQKPNCLSKKGPILTSGIFAKFFSFRVFRVVSGQSIPVSGLKEPDPFVRPLAD